MWKLKLICSLIFYQQIVKAKPLDLNFGAANEGKGLLGAIENLKYELTKPATSLLNNANAQLTHTFGGLSLQSGFNSNQPNTVPNTDQTNQNNQEPQSGENLFSENNTNGLNHQSAPSSSLEKLRQQPGESNLPRDVEEVVDLEISSDSSKSVETHPESFNNKKLINIAPLQSGLKNGLGILSNGAIGVGSRLLDGLSTVHKIGQRNLENIQTFGQKQLSTGQQITDSAGTELRAARSGLINISTNAEDLYNRGKDTTKNAASDASTLGNTGLSTIHNVGTGIARGIGTVVGGGLEGIRTGTQAIKGLGDSLLKKYN